MSTIEIIIFRAKQDLFTSLCVFQNWYPQVPGINPYGFFYPSFSFITYILSVTWFAIFFF